jgi:hypothetical protein
VVIVGSFMAIKPVLHQLQIAADLLPESLDQALWIVAEADGEGGLDRNDAQRQEADRRE